MTTIITRYFDSADQAQSAKRELMYTYNVPPAIIRIYSGKKDLAKTLQVADVVPETAKAYEDRMSPGGAVLMVRGKYTPLGVAKITRKVAAEKGAVAMGDLNQDHFVKDARGRGLSILPEHPHILLRQKDPSERNHYMADWPIPLISRRKPYDEMAIPRHGRMADWPIPLLSRRKPADKFAFPRHARMANWPIPLISQRKPWDKFAFPRHARMANWPIPLISRRKPWDKFAFPRHMRMANWPFPHLINGKQGTNALIPGGPRMADFPIPLLSDRKPYDNMIISRHGRVANWPLPLISRRKPFTGSVIPKHGHMANMILPLVVRRDGSEGQGWSFSKMLGLPTLKRR